MSVKYVTDNADAEDNKAGGGGVNIGVHSLMHKTVTAFLRYRTVPEENIITEITIQISVKKSDIQKTDMEKFSSGKFLYQKNF